MAPPSSTSADALPDAPERAQYPDAEPVATKDEGRPVHIEAATQQESGGVYVLDGDVEIHYDDRVINADHIEYDQATGDAKLTGHVQVTGGKNDERLHASHGELNVKTGAGRFYDVWGSVGMKLAAKASTEPGIVSGTQKLVYSNGNPFLFTGRVVVKTGPQAYEVYDGTVTSCQLPHPDWMLYAAKFTMDGEKARATNSVFRLRNIPLVYLPYVTHPVDAEDRQSGILIPVVGDSSSKGLTFGEQFYWAINRSTDLTLGTIYYSDRGWGQTASFRYRGLRQNFAKAHYSGLQDRGYTPSGGVYTNQSGTDLVASGRRDLTWNGDSEQGTPNHQTRGVVDVEYLSSFLYREAFTDNFNQAVSSDVLSTMYGTHEWNGFAASVEGDRYQGEKRVATTLLPEQQVHIFHAPSLEFTTTDHRLGSTGLEWNVDSSASALKRIQPNFVTSGMIERMDLRPEIAYPMGLAGWRVRPSVAVRETFYSRSRVPPAPGAPGVPVESTSPLNRSNVDVRVDVRAPVVERTFDSGWVKKLLRHDVKHTIEPELTYRYANGIGNFQRVLRFDSVDVASDTNEIQYGATQRLFLRRSGNQPCHAADKRADALEVLGPTGQSEVEAGEPVELPGSKADEAAPVCGNREWISWRVTQKYFFDPTFDGAVQNGRRNILDTTLAFSGIAFLTESRQISPLLSRLRVRTSEKTDFEWDFDFDTGAKKFTANNVYADVHQKMFDKDVFAGITYARLNAPGRSYVEGVASAVANFSQMRVLTGWGKPTAPGFSAVANVGLDLNLATVQYGSLQTTYNWNCCGFSVEYRKYELGTARNENAYRFNFTLANIGSAGNIKRAQQTF